MEIRIKDEEQEFDLGVYGIFKEEDGFELINTNEDFSFLQSEIKRNGIDVKENSVFYFSFNEKSYLFYVLKEDYILEDLREVSNKVYNFLCTRKFGCVLFSICENSLDVFRAFVDGLDLSNYKFDKYLSKKEKNDDFIICFNVDSSFKSSLDRFLLINKNVKLTRDLVNENSDIVNSDFFEEISLDFANKNNLKIEVLKRKDLEEKGLGLLSAVGRASLNEPRLILIEYLGDENSDEKIALVGKGVTFDVGGVNLKPTGFLEDMKSDMAGAASVFGIFKSAVEMKIEKNLVLVMGVVENALDSNSYKCGDVFESYVGRTVEVLNTDAEGRLVLSDSMGYVQKNYGVNVVLDVATLTGGCLIALGTNIIAMMGNDSGLKKEIFDVGESIGERVWELPIYDEHRKLLKSDIADMKNVGGKFASAIQGGVFLEKFVEEGVKWVHLDIAGAGRTRGEAPSYVGKFGTGRSVRLIVDWLSKD